jgi:hypothetical protein
LISRVYTSGKGNTSPYHEVAKNSNKRGANRRVTQNKSPNKGYKNPPQIDCPIRQKHRFRYEETQDGGADVTIYNKDLLDLVCMATASNVAYRVLDGVKLDLVEMWSCNNPSISNYSNQITLEWLNTQYSGAPGNTYTDQAMGATDIAHICARPPKEAGSAFWIADGDRTPLFNMRLPQYTIVDIVVEVVFADTDSAILVSGAVAGATLGQLYYRYLDSNSGQTLRPTGANYI